MDRKAKDYEENKKREDVALSMVVEAFEEAIAFKRPIVAKWNAAYNMVHGISKKDRNRSAWQSNQFVPLIGMALDLIVPRLFQGLPAANPEANTLRAAANQEAMAQLLDYDQDRMGLEKVMNAYIKDGVMYGLAVRYDGWRKETKDNVPHTPKFMDKMINRISALFKGFKASDLLYDGPEVRRVDPFAFLWDPAGGDDIDRCAWVGEVSEESVYQLRKDPSLNIDKIVEIKKYESDPGLEATFKERLKSMGYLDADVKRMYEDIKNGKHLVYRYRGAFDIDGDGIEEECKITVVDKMHVCALEESVEWHGKKPYTVWQFDLIPGQMVGRSLVDRAAQLQIEFNDAMNQASDMRKLTLKPMLKYKLGSGTDPETLRIAPGNPIGVKSMDDLVWDRPPDFTQQLDLVMTTIRELFQLVTGANDVVLGQQDVGIGDNTATGASIAQEQTEMRFKQFAIMLDLSIERAGNILISNEQQFRDRKMEVPVRNAEGVTYKQIAPKDIMGTFSYKMESGSLQQDSMVMRINKLIKLKEVTAQNPSVDQSKIDQQIMLAMGIDPATIQIAKTVGQDDGVAKFMQLPPDQQQQYLATLNPDDRALLEKALAVAQQNGQGNQAAPPAPPVGGQPVNGAPQQPGLPAPQLQAQAISGPMPPGAR